MDSVPEDSRRCTTTRASKVLYSTRSSDTEEVQVIERGSVHAGLDAVCCPSPVP